MAFLPVSFNSQYANRRAKLAQAQNNDLAGYLSLLKAQQASAAPINAALAEEFKRKKQIEADTLVANMAKGLKFSGADRLDEGSPLLKKLQALPAYQQADEATRLKMQNEAILKNPTAFTDPSRFSNELADALRQTGQFTGQEIQNYVANEVASNWPTIGDKKQEMMLDALKPLLKGANGGSGGGSGGGSRGKPAYGLPGVKDLNTEITALATTLGLPDTPDTYFGYRGDIGNADVTQSDLGNMAAVMKTKGINSPTAIANALRLAINDDKTLKPNYDWVNNPEAQEKLVALAKQIEATETKGQGGATGSVGGIGGLGIDPAAYQQAVQQILAQGTPRSASDNDLLQLLSQYLPQPQSTYRQNTRQSSGKTNANTANSDITLPSEEKTQQNAEYTIPEKDIGKAVIKKAKQLAGGEKQWNQLSPNEQLQLTAQATQLRQQYGDKALMENTQEEPSYFDQVLQGLSTMSDTVEKYSPISIASRLYQELTAPGILYTSKNSKLPLTKARAIAVLKQKYGNKWADFSDTKRRVLLEHYLKQNNG